MIKRKEGLTLLSFYLSVLNKFTGKPSAENKLGMAVLVNPNLTCTGSLTVLADTKTVFSSILALAGTKTPSAPAMKKSVNSPPLLTSVVGTSLN